MNYQSHATGIKILQAAGESEDPRGRPGPASKRLLEALFSKKFNNPRGNR